jgi:hypothetical protein
MYLMYSVYSENGDCRVLEPLLMHISLKSRMELLLFHLPWVLMLATDMAERI